jgi:hypothetical protein
MNFDGPIACCVISRYHGGAFVVFSNAPAGSGKNLNRGAS